MMTIDWDVEMGQVQLMAAWEGYNDMVVDGDEHKVYLY